MPERSMKAVRFIGGSGPASYESTLVEADIAVIDTLLPHPNVTLRFHIDGRPLHVSPNKHARDFLDIAVLVYILDELEARNHTADGWSRHFNVVFPVERPDAWQIGTNSLVATLATLTGDHFEFEWMKRPTLPSLGHHRIGLPRGF